MVSPEADSARPSAPRPPRRPDLGLAPTCASRVRRGLLVAVVLVLLDQLLTSAGVRRLGCLVVCSASYRTPPGESGLLYQPVTSVAVGPGLLVARGRSVSASSGQRQRFCCFPGASGAELPAPAPQPSDYKPRRSRPLPSQGCLMVLVRVYGSSIVVQDDPPPLLSDLLIRRPQRRVAGNPYLHALRPACRRPTVHRPRWPPGASSPGHPTAPRRNVLVTPRTGNRQSVNRAR
jgi:hypothetical protein